MESIKIGVNRQMNGYNFSISPSVRQLIKQIFPNAFPAKSLFIGYDSTTEFEKNIDLIEPHIFMALLGVSNEDELASIGAVEFVDSDTGKTMHRYNA